MTNFRSLSVRICWFSLFWAVGWAEEKIWRQLDGYWMDISCRHSWVYWSSDLSSCSTNMSDSCLHACLSSAARKRWILCTLCNFRCRILHFVRPGCLKRAVEILSGSHGDRQTLQTIKTFTAPDVCGATREIKEEGGGLKFRSLHVHITAFIYLLFSDHRPHWSLTKRVNIAFHLRMGNSWIMREVKAVPLYPALFWSCSGSQVAHDLFNKERHVSPQLTCRTVWEGPRIRRRKDSYTFMSSVFLIWSRPVGLCSSFFF